MWRGWHYNHVTNILQYRSRQFPRLLLTKNARLFQECPDQSTGPMGALSGSIEDTGLPLRGSSSIHAYSLDNFAGKICLCCAVNVSVGGAHEETLEQASINGNRIASRIPSTSVLDSKNKQHTVVISSRMTTWYYRIGESLLIHPRLLFDTSP